MAPVTIPAATVRVSVFDATVDRIAFEHALAALGDRGQAGRLTGYVAEVLKANPGLARKGLVLPLGTVVHLPAHTVDRTRDVTPRRLWD